VLGLKRADTDRTVVAYGTPAIDGLCSLVGQGGAPSGCRRFRVPVFSERALRSMNYINILQVRMRRRPLDGVIIRVDTGEGPTGPRDRAAHLIGPWALNRAAITCIPGHPHGGDEA
jgi:hypothetical protein